ncbi:MAG: biotin synthase BioB [Syntrophales bacterium]
MDSFIETMKERALQRQAIGAEDAFRLFDNGEKHPFYIMAAASEIREHFKGKTIKLCSIVNAKSGRCSENCTFCAQSAHYKTDAPVYPLLSAEKIIQEADSAAESGAHFFGIVTSGKRVSGRKEWQVIHEAVRGISGLGLKPCASLGIIDRKKALELKEAGLYRYHHNLETARSFFRNICTTHDYEEDVETVRAAKDAGLSTCCGGLIGLGEDIGHRIELALTLKELDVDSVPVNILNPIPGTPLAGAASLSPLEILLTIAIFRFILPERDIKLCGGKEKNLRQLLPLGIVAGCNSLMTGNYLTTLGRNTALDIEMIKDLGLEWRISER